MGGPWPRPAMVARWLSLLLLLSLAGVVLQVHGQADNLGFISIDCGLPESAAGYVDNATKLSFVSDAGFIDTGINCNMSAEYITPSMGRGWHTVRSFAGASARNCYTLRSLVSRLKYLIRATFMYGNYDGLNKIPVFDLHVGVNYWTTVNISDADMPVMVEVITVNAGDPAQVCLVNTGSGTPFISGLSLRPLKNSLYPMANATQGLVLFSRSNLGSTDGEVIRFPDDPHDRFWFPESKPTEWSEITTPLKVQHYDNDNFDVLSAVLQTAVRPINASKPIEYSWDAAEQSAKNPVLGYMCILHFSELQLLPPGTTRQFYVNINGILSLDNGFTPDYLHSDTVYSTRAYYGFHQYIVCLNATANSTLPPVLNALEIFSVVPTTGVPTAAQDISALTAIRERYQLKKNWMGDPCVLKNFAWNGLGCSYAVSSPPSVTGLNLSFSGLSGNISTSFASIRGLQYLDLTGNQLSGSIPSGLLKRMQDGSLTLRFGNNPNLCSNGDSCQPPKKKKISKAPIYAVVPIVAMLVIVFLSVLLICILRKKQGKSARDSIRLQGKHRTITHSGKQWTQFVVP